MAYSSDFLKDKVTIQNRTASRDGAFGREGGQFVDGATIHCNAKWTKGAKALREGALDAFDTVMFRCRWREDLKRESRLKWKGRIYQIESFYDDYEANEIQITAVELQK